MDSQRALPRFELRSVIRSFGEICGDLGPTVVSWPVAARPHQILDFHLADPYQVRLDGGPPTVSPQTFVVGPQTYCRAQIFLTGQIHVFTILFQATGLNRLVGINMTSLVNEAPSTSDVIGKSAATLSDAVRAAPSFHLRVAAVERWAGMMLDEREPDSAIEHASRLLTAVGGCARIDDVVARSGLSARQFQRRFETRVGLTPKLFARTVRFDRALVAHRDAPERLWTDIVHDAGYFDQAHFIRDCHAFAGLPPSGFVGEWDNIFFPGR